MKKIAAFHLSRRNSLFFGFEKLIVVLALSGALSWGTVGTVSAASSFSGGVGLFLAVSPLDKNMVTYYITPQAKKARSYGLQFVNLIVHWSDIEPSNDTFNFKMLQTAVKAVQTEGLKCVLRIYLNGGSYVQAAPNWLFDVRGAQSYLEGSFRQPVPWDPKYQEEMAELLMKLGTWLKDNGSVRPDAVQISAGGIYGEQGVLGIDWQTQFNGDYDAYYLRLIEAEKRHLEVFRMFAWYHQVPSILMVAHLYDNNPDMDDLLIQHGDVLGLQWLQTNSWSGELQQAWYGPQIMEMLARHADRMSCYLEDEYGSKYQESIASRTSRILSLESSFGVRFRAVSISPDDLTGANQPSILSLVSHVTAP